MSGDPDNDYFSDGITDDIIGALTQVRGLRVAARASAFSYKGKNEDLATIGRTLGRLILPATIGPPRRLLRDRLMSGGMYADETRIHELLDDGFTIESLTRMHSEAHLHCLCIARKDAR